MLTSLVRIPTSETADTPEDIFTSAIGFIFTDDLCNQHGDPGSSIIYKSAAFGDLELSLADPEGEDGRKLFAHYLWNSSILMGELIGATCRDLQPKQRDRSWVVRGQKVLELGAGTGLAGIVCTLAGADLVAISDYPTPELLENIERNVSKNIPESLQSHVTVVGHEWGVFNDDFAIKNAQGFSRVLAADCLWMPWQHENLARSMLHFLSPDPDAQVWVIAAFHTGRAKLVLFFKVAKEIGLEVEDIWELDVDLQHREWAEERDGGHEDSTERKKWLVLAVLRRARDQHEGIPDTASPK